jgi:hypothetical protein
MVRVSASLYRARVVGGR